VRDRALLDAGDATSSRSSITPLIPISRIACATVSSSHVLRTVHSLRVSADRIAVTAGSLR
jgi:hypothetical protein